MNICVSVNSKYARYLYVMLTSLYENNAGEDIEVYVLQRDLTEKDKTNLTSLSDKFGQKTYFIDVDITIFSEVPTSLKFSVETYFRLYMPWLLPPDIERVLYLDVDVIVQKNLSELYNTELDGFYFAACKDQNYPELTGNKKELFGRDDHLMYFNAGVMIWRPSIIRENYVFNDFIEAARELNFILPWVDQDLLNYMLFDKVLYVDDMKYDFMVSGLSEQYLSDHIQKAYILHYAGLNPWMVGPKNSAYDIWWSYAEKTPFYRELILEQLKRCEIDLSIIERGNELRNIFEYAYNLKGTGKICRYVDFCDKKLILYGAGNIGKNTLLFLRDDNASMPVGFVDKNLIGYVDAIPVYQGFDWIDSEESYMLLVTPASGTLSIVNELKEIVPDNVEVLSVLQFLIKCSQVI